MSNTAAKANAQQRPTSQYGNFRDPLGLVWRLLREGGSIGRWMLAAEALSKLVVPYDFVLSPKERRLRDAAQPSDLPIVLIVGPPRSGTTLLYQILVQHLDVSYFTNRNAMFSRSPVVAAKRFDRNAQPREGDYASLYGNTAGFSGANDGFHVWNEFLGVDRYNASNDFSDEMQQQMRLFFQAWLAATRKPLVNKNNRNTVCVGQLARALPNAHFVVVDRDPFFIAQSLLKARRWVQGSKKLGWGLHSRRASSDNPLAYADAVCEQIRTHQREIVRQREEVDAARWIDVDYNRICEHPGDVVADIQEGTPGLALRANRPLTGLKGFTPSSQVTVTEEVADRIRQQLKVDAPAALRGPTHIGGGVESATRKP